MSSRDLAVVLAGSLVAASLTACRRPAHQTDDPGERVGTATLTGALVYVPNDIAREQLAQARCEHAMKCEDVGEGKRYRDPSECTVRVQVELQPRLDRAECPTGVDELALRACVEATAREACGDDGAGARRSAACAPEKLCRRP